MLGLDELGVWLRSKVGFGLGCGGIGLIVAHLMYPLGVGWYGRANKAASSVSSVQGYDKIFAVWSCRFQDDASRFDLP